MTAVASCHRGEKSLSYLIPMKTVGKQLKEARLARNWTPELAARETKIKVDRLRDLESDDYSHFTSPTYARGFVRTYARALGLDEYKILRQLDNKLPDDDSANIVTDSGVAYLPETAMPPRAAHRDYTGLYIVMGLGVVVTMAIAFVLFEAYRVGELSRWFATTSEPVAVSLTNAATATPPAETPARALPVDSNTPPPIADATNAAAATNAAVAVSVPANPTDAGNTNSASAAVVPGLVSPRALPVDPSGLGADTNAAPVEAVRALPVDPTELTNAAPVTPTSSPTITSAPGNAPAQDAPIVAPRALPVDPSELTNAPPATPAPTTNVALNTAPPSPPSVTPPPDPAPPTALPTPVSGPSARASNSGPVIEPSPPPVEPSPASTPVAPPVSETQTSGGPPTTTTTDSGKPLVLTASQDSFVRVTNLDSPDAEKPLYAAVLHGGESVGFDGHKFSINVGIPSAVEIKLDGVNYGPHSDQDVPETFTVQSHLQ